MVYSVSKDGALFIWRYETDPTSGASRWIVSKKHFFFQGKVHAAALHRESNILVVGFANGFDVHQHHSPFFTSPPLT